MTRVPLVLPAIAAGLLALAIALGLAGTDGALASGVAAVSAGGSHTCALTAEGGVKCWGANYAGQLGDGTTTSSSTPVDVSGLTSGVAAISAGARHTCALTTAGTVKCWGNNFEGQLGNGSSDGPNNCGSPDYPSACSLTPVDVTGLDESATAVSAGGSHTCALAAAGSIKCWGSNFSGELGDGQACGYRCATPVDVSELTGGVAAVSVGGAHTCVLTKTGGIKCWGQNDYGQVGDGQVCGNRCLTPVDVSGLTSDVAAVSVGGEHTCALTTAGGAKCWGSNSLGQLGDGTGGGSTGPVSCTLAGMLIACSTTPVDVSGMTSGVAAVSAGGQHTCALTTDGGLKCWGLNHEGELGTGTNGPQACTRLGFNYMCSKLPQDVSGLASVSAIYSGGNHSCALTAAGAPKCWGINQFGQLGNGTNAGPQKCGGAVGSTVISYACSTTPLDVTGLKTTPIPCPKTCVTPTVTPTLRPTPTATPVQRGDVNCDGHIDAIDAVLVLQLSGGLIASLPCPDAGDLNYDGTTTAVDAALILQYTAGFT